MPKRRIYHGLDLPQFYQRFATIRCKCCAEFVVGISSDSITPAAAGRFTIAEVEELAETSEHNPMHIHPPGTFVQLVVHTPGIEKRIEKRTVTV